MPIPVTCPGCQAKMKAPDGAAGKKIKCPKCGDPITVPAPEPIDDFEVVDEEPAKKPAPAATAKPKPKAVVEADEDEEEEKPKKKPVKAAVEDDEEEKPKKKPAKAVADDDEEEEEKPKKKKDDEEDEEEEEKPKKKAKAAKDEDDEEDDDRPKKKKKKKRSSDDDDEEGGVSMARNIIGAVILIVLLGVVAFVYWSKFGNKDEKSSGTSSGGDTPSAQNGQPAGPPPGGPTGLPGPKLPGPAGLGGEKEVAFKSKEGKFSVMMPGKPVERTGQTPGGRQKHEVIVDQNDRVFMVVYADSPGASRAGDAVLTGLADAMSKDGRVISTDKITLGAKKHPGRELIFEKPDLMTFFRGRYFLVGDRLYQVVAAGPQDFLKSAPVETFLNSFAVEE